MYTFSLEKWHETILRGPLMKPAHKYVDSVINVFNYYFKTLQLLKFKLFIIKVHMM